MRPAFSVILFTTLSGAGYGLWFWSALVLLQSAELQASDLAYTFILGFILVSGGLLSSTAHLGQPQRAWRAFSQWRSSWLSREGVSAVLCFIPASILIYGCYEDLHPALASLAATALAILSITTVIATAMIYASLRTIPAWHHWRVLPIYLLFALYTGLWLMLALSKFEVLALLISPLKTVLVFGLALLALKFGYWATIDRQRMPSTASALGLNHDRKVQLFEQPHSAENYITREFVFVLARRWSHSLRMISAALFVGLPLLIVLLDHYLSISLPAAVWIIVASIVAGTVLERWLFFAQARHVVSTYYQADSVIKSAQ